MKHFPESLLAVSLVALAACSTPQFAHHQSFSVVGKDGRTYSLQILWNEIKYIPGDHAIRVITVDSRNHSRVQDFRSGNRAGLYAVSVLHKEGHDEVVFHVAGYYGPNFTYTNTVDASGLRDYPEMVKRFEEQRGKPPNKNAR
jgi:hypothetical protein